MSNSYHNDVMLKGIGYNASPYRNPDLTLKSFDLFDFDFAFYSIQIFCI